ncbi:MAG: VanZ family protein [Chitinophagales bacterium]|nr:VanZ family protein [Chitinophagales bacterium]MCZ2393876.1 VanZ family protein [Chitinophagales bacterium]
MKNIFKYPLARWIILISYLGLIFYLCLLPADSIKSNLFLDKIFFDKWVHFLMYFGLWTLWVWRRKGAGYLKIRRNNIFLIAFLAVLLIGVVIEFLQSLTDRSMDWTDILANICGAFFAWRFWLQFETKWKIYQW